MTIRPCDVIEDSVRRLLAVDPVADENAGGGPVLFT